MIVEAVRALTTFVPAMREAHQHCISDSVWANVLSKFKRELLTKPSNVFGSDLGKLREFIMQCAEAVSTGDEKALGAIVADHMPRLVKIAERDFAPQLTVVRERRQGADLRQPHTWYPLARSMKRKIIFHAGPTNSGKTYNALQALKNAWSGVYCGPLRLLALEVFESMNQDGVSTSLLTGQERREIPFARHAACTVEMLDVETTVDVAVIDEIQMIGDDGRGASWTRAVLGVPAMEVHLCGDPAAEPVVRYLAAITGDELEVVHYQRLTAISVLKESMAGDYSKVEEGDCVVAFSRKDIYAIRRLIERKTHHKCCVVYGSLPPETRSSQARLFNDPNSGYRVLVASDAIGMGLNLNIRRVVFHTMNKYNGQSVGPVPPASVKQIAGRAGRRSSIYPEGFSTTLQDTDLSYLHACMGAPTPPITAAGLFPNAEQLSAFASLLPRGTALSTVISEFTNASQLDGPYFMCRSDDVASTAALLEHYNTALSMEQRSALCLVPANLRNPEVRKYFMIFLDQYTAGQPVRLKLQLPLNDPDYLVHDLESLEAKASSLDMYLWLAARIGTAGANFPDIEEAVNKRSAVSDMLEAALAQLTENTKETMTFSARKRSWAEAALKRKVEQRSAGRAGAGREVRAAREVTPQATLTALTPVPPSIAPSIREQAGLGGAGVSNSVGLEDLDSDEEETAYATRHRDRGSRRTGPLDLARKNVLRVAQEAAQAGISERTATRLQQEYRKQRLASGRPGRSHGHGHEKNAGGQARPQLQLGLSTAVPAPMPAQEAAMA